MLAVSSPVTLLGSFLGIWVAPAVSFSLVTPPTSSLVSRDGGVRARTSLRLHPRQKERQQQEEEDVDDDPASRTSGTDFRDFDRTSSPVKAFVGGLTDLFVRFSGQDQDSLPPAAPKVSEETLVLASVGVSVASIATQGRLTVGLSHYLVRNMWK